jgi:hypothetical protein
MTLARKVMMYPISQAGIPAAAQSSSAAFRFPAGLRLLKKVDGITRRLSVFAA